MTLLEVGDACCYPKIPRRPNFVEVPQKDALVKDTSGAGDCFLGSLSYFLGRSRKYQKLAAVLATVPRSASEEKAPKAVFE